MCQYSFECVCKLNSNLLLIINNNICQKNILKIIIRVMLNGVSETLIKHTKKGN
jgi:hypothetical protein